ncbi:MAG: hypothetical protein ABIS45_12100 [Burkholderiales bacterium]
MALQIPDPRRYAESATTAGSEPPTSDLSGRLKAMLENGDDVRVMSALRAAPSPASYAEVWRAIGEAAHQPEAAPTEGAIIARLFALPLVIITGSNRPATLPGVVPDIAEVTALFEQHGALGPTRNFGLGNALCSLETMDTITSSEVYKWTRDIDAPRREFPPSPIVIEKPGEEVHLRFLVGAGIAPATAPSFVETAANIGIWGMPFTRLLAAQFAQAGVEVLPLARPPLELLRAAHAGRCAQLDAAFNLFVSNAVRRFRGATGDPVAVISAHDDADVRVSLSSQFDDTVLDGFRWPLHPLDNVARIVDSIGELLAACRVGNVRCVERVLPALDPHGLPWFVSVRDADRLDAGVTCH